MSWSPRDHRMLSGEKDAFSPSPPPESFADDVPIPSYAAGLEDYMDEDTWPLHAEKRLLQETGMMSGAQLARFGWLMRRGLNET
jgi:hypothetical protein